VSLPGDERTTRGYAAVSILILDEASRVSDDLMAALMPMTAVSGGRIIAMSTPFGKRGWFFEATQSNGWRTITVRADECPRWSAEDLEEFRSQRGDWLYRQEILAEFVDATGQMFNSDDVEAAFKAGELGTVSAVPLFGRKGLSLGVGGVA
jgi:hypothetical protein